MDENKIPIQPQAVPGVQSGPGGQPGQQIQIPVDASSRETVYVNFFQAHMSNDELFLDLAAFPGLVGTTPEAIALTHRLVMNFYTAKRLLTALGMTIQRHEGTFGSIELDVRRRATSQPPSYPQPGRVGPQGMVE